MLFDGKTPKMCRAARDVVLDVEKSGPELVPATVRREQDHDEEEVVLRPDLEAAPDEEAFAVDLSVDTPLLDEEAAHKKAAEHKEDNDRLTSQARDRIGQRSQG